MGRRAVAIVGLLVGLASCSLLYSTGDDLARGLTNASAVDEAGTSSTTPKPSTNGGDGGDAATSAPACPPNAIFCDDFEHDDLPGRFDTQTGQLVISSTFAHSGTRSLGARLSRNHDSPYLDVQIDKSAKVVVSLWFLAPTRLAVDYHVRLASVLWGPVCEWPFAWQLSLTQDGLISDDDTYAPGNGSCGPADFHADSLLSPDEVYDAKWHHVVATQDTSTSKRTVTVQVDDKAPHSSSLVSSQNGAVTDLHLSVGLPCVQQTGGCFDWDQQNDYGVFIDDVSLTATQ